MSFTKQTIESLNNASFKIINETTEDNDLTEILKSLNIVFEIAERISEKNNITNFYWNEIVSEMLAVIYSTLSGYSRLGTTGLRNILELVCHAFYYYDHHIELKLSQNENLKADKYVSVLVNDYHFFTTKYIKTFYQSIEDDQAKADSVSSFLKKEYSSLCDFVHGRNNTLSKQENLKVQYIKVNFKKFENHFLNISSLISTMYILRFNDKSNSSILDLSRKTNLIKL